MYLSVHPPAIIFKLSEMLQEKCLLKLQLSRTKEAALSCMQSKDGNKVWKIYLKSKESCLIPHFIWIENRTLKFNR